jgi:hypothetical protein
MAAPQSFKNHAKIDPVFHYVLTPLLFLNFLFSFVILFHSYSDHLYLALWWVVLSFILLLAIANTRRYTLAVQDRLIRLEELLRLTALLPAEEHALISTFTTRQLIALRFASDGELPALARRTLAEISSPNRSNRPSPSGAPTSSASKL